MKTREGSRSCREDPTAAMSRIHRTCGRTKICVRRMACRYHFLRCRWGKSIDFFGEMLVGIGWIWHTIGSAAAIPGERTAV